MDYARASERLDHARKTVVLCRQRLDEALEEEARRDVEAQKLRSVARRIRQTFQHNLEVANGAREEGEDVAEPETPTRPADNPVDTESEPPTASDVGCADGAASDAGGVSVSVLTPSPYTPNPVGHYRSPLGASRSYVCLDRPTLGAL